MTNHGTNARKLISAVTMYLDAYAICRYRVSSFVVQKSLFPYFIYFQSLSENDLGVVGAMVIDEVLNSNSWLTQLNLSGESPTNAKAEVTRIHIALTLDVFSKFVNTV